MRPISYDRLLCNDYHWGVIDRANGNNHLDTRDSTSLVGLAQRQAYTDGYRTENPSRTVRIWELYDPAR